MPTPVATARQCLTDDAARALDDAVSVARRRCHSQTTSLHAVSALLALPASRLREACSRARASGGGYSPGLQLRALELCVGVSLDRLPSGKSAAEDEDPPISNSLMAAIKRSQANQRRNPESFHLQQMHQSQQMTAAVVMKVELKHYVLSILDDPIVSRVFGDAGYRSCDVKLGILHPPVSVGLRFGRPVRCPPLFMMESDLSGGSGWRGPGFPFGGGSGGVDVDENCRRIGEVMVRKSGRNPLLVGACANEALVSFKACVARRKAGILPGEILGLDIVCVTELVEEFVSLGGGGGSEEKVRVKLKELEVAVESGPGPGVVVSFGELKVLIGESSSSEAASYLVSRMADMLRRYCGRLWLIGAVEDDEMFKKLVAKHPAMEADWGLQLVPITSKPLGDGFGAKSSFMGSFIPFGGFFSNPSDYKGSSSSATQITTRCQLCNEKYEQEISTVLKGGGSISIADQCSSSLPSWLQANIEQSKEADAGKAQCDGTAFRARILGLQKKWNEICQNLHPNHLSPKSGVSGSKNQSVGTGSFHVVEEKKQSSSSRDSSVSQGSCPNTSPCMATSSSRGSRREIMEVSRASGKMTQSPPKLSSIVSTSKRLPVSLPQHDSCIHPDQVPASSMITVTTDLGLGTIYASANHSRNHTIQDNGERVQSILTSVSKELNTVSPSIADHLSKSSFHGSVVRRPVDLRDFKLLWQALIDRVGWQDEAICKISHCISRCRSSIERRRSSNLWLCFVGPDKVGKRKIAAALAEAVTGSKQDLVFVDLHAQDGVEQSDSIFCCNELKGHDILNRGKTMADSIAAKLCSRPNSVVFFENLDKADMLIQSSLSRAVKTAKFPDSHGREVSLNNMIFILSISASSKNIEDISCGTNKARLSEEIISEAKCWKLRITTTGHVAAQSSQSNYKNVMITQPELRILGKRKCGDETSNFSAGIQKAMRSFLDLNRPVEELEDEIENQRSDSDAASISESSEAWLEEFSNEVDEKVALKPFNFDALADKVLHSISETFHTQFGSNALLQIDHQAIVQIVAATWLSDRITAVEDWVKSVLSRSFIEARQRCNLSPQSAVQLLACEGMLMDEQAPDIRLPSSIILN